MQRGEREKSVRFIRHGQSAENVAPVFQSPDAPLSAKGREEATQVARRISKLFFEALIASPLKRAAETAEAIFLETGREPEFSDIFAERRKPTALNGRPYDDSQARLLWRAWEESCYTPGVRVEDGENFDDILLRADTALAVLRDRPEKSLVVVTHGNFLRTIVARVLFGELLNGESLRSFQYTAMMGNASITALQYKEAFEQEARWRLSTYNDQAHLAEHSG